MKNGAGGGGLAAGCGAGPAAVVAGAALSGCAADSRAPAMVPAVASPPARIGIPGPTESPTGAGWPPFAWSFGPVSATRLGRSWHRGCPVGPAGLRLLRVRYAGF